MDTGLVRIPVGDGFVELPAVRPPLSHRPPAPRPARPRPAFRPPSADQPGQATAAGWSFLSGPSSVAGPFAAGFVVEVAVGDGGFEVVGRPVRPATMAAHLAGVCPPERPVLLVPSGTSISALALTLLIESVVDALDRPILAGDTGTRLTPAGIALGRFRRLHPRPGRSARRVDDIGPVLPAPRAGLAPPAPLVLATPPVRPAAPPPDGAVTPPSSVAPAPAVAPVTAPRPAATMARPAETSAAASPPATGAPSEPPATKPVAVDGAVAELCAPGRPVRHFPVLAGPINPSAATADPAPGQTPDPAGPPPAPVIAGVSEATEATATARWLTEATADRAAVRQVLNGRYDAHARIVARRLSEDPGLRAVAGSAAGLTAGLVAVRAYLLEERDTVNRVLRGHGAEDEHTRADVIARTAVYGLHRLPPVFGPVFHAAAATSVAASGYRAGDELIEPAFLDVDLVPAEAGEDATVEMAIWSVSARRVGGLEAGGTTALFPPGSRFAVLAVDRAGDAPPRVLLHDLSVARRSGRVDPDRILSRLRETRRSGRAPGRRTRSRIAPGLDDSGLRFRRPNESQPRPKDGAA
ncbi:hypothetical protein [Actinoplanes sp. NPDC049265]|uniref:hypothetical protein n=1 Tax=Actinoplanes sp. NPDC049265 TaxID=3363902 RepID=UPI00372426B9